MNADELIDSYVADVVQFLPRKQRQDVAQELRTLLREEVDAVAGERAAREAAAREILAGFGRPAEVAARYGTPVTLIERADTRNFLTLAIGGAVLILVGAVLDELVNATGAQRDVERSVQQAWPNVFAWVGLLVVGFAIAAWLRRRRPGATWNPHPLPTDRVNRVGRGAALAFFTVSTLVLANLEWVIRTLTGGRATQPAYHAFAYDEAFLRLRGPVVLALMVAGLVIQSGLVVQGRWRPWSRRADLVNSIAVCVILTWAIGAGPIFQAAPTDRAVKGTSALIVLVTLADLAVRMRRQSVQQALRPPASAATAG
jgi:hypothetical protein